MNNKNFLLSRCDDGDTALSCLHCVIKKVFKKVPKIPVSIKIETTLFTRKLGGCEGGV